MRYALLIEYDGTDLHGSQLQKGVRTVQGELERAIGQVYRSEPRVSLASRTDAGVHARGQVAAFDEDERHQPSTLRNALNFHLPEDVAIRKVECVEDGFDPRRQALEREYDFVINDGPARSPIRRKQEVRTKRLDKLDDMNRAGHSLVGSHDFASFAGPAVPAEAATVRNIRSVDVDRIESDRVQVKIVGNAFLHQQVRRMTGALTRIGFGKMDGDELKALVDHPQRGAANWPLAPAGLFLTGIEYGKDGPFQVETEYN